MSNLTRTLVTGALATLAIAAVAEGAAAAPVPAFTAAALEQNGQVVSVGANRLVIAAAWRRKVLSSAAQIGSPVAEPYVKDDKGGWCNFCKSASLRDPRILINPAPDLLLLHKNIFQQ